MNTRTLHLPILVIILIFNTVKLCGQTVNITYAYDSLNRITKVAYSNGVAIAYTYDAAGNRTTVQIDGVEYKADVTPRPAGKKTGVISGGDWDQVGRFAAGIDAITNTSELQRADSAPLTALGNGKIDVFDWVQAGRFFAGLDDLVPANSSIPAFSAFSFLTSKTNFTAEANRAIRITSPTLQRGQSNQVNLEFDASGDENAIAFSLNFDPALFTFTSANSPLADAQVLVNTSQATSGKIGLILTLNPGKTFAAGTSTIANVRFQLSSGVTTVSRLFFGDQTIATGVSDIYANPLVAAYTESSLTLNGDVAAPTITSLTPNTTNTGGSGFALTVNGTNFVSGATVQWNGQNRVTNFVSGTILNANILASDITTKGFAVIKVVNPASNGGVSNEMTFTVMGPVPSLTSISPSVKTQGEAGFTLTLNGTNFLGSSIVRWNGLDRPTSFISSTQLQAIISDADLAKAGTALVTAYNAPPGGGTTTPQTFTIISAGYEADVVPRPTGKRNGTVALTDWIQMGRFVAGLDTPAIGSEFQRTDCAPRAIFGDGRITLADWVQAGRYMVGLDPVVIAGGPVEPPPPVASPVTIQRIVRVNSTQWLRGKINTLQVSMDARGDENGLAFSLNYDPKIMTFLDASLGDGATGASLQVNAIKAANGLVGIVVILPAGQQFVVGTRNLVTLQFIPSGGDGNTNTVVSFSDQSITRELVDTNASPIGGVTYTGANLTITGKAVATVSAANYVGGEQAAESIVSAFGTQLAWITLAAPSLPLPISLGGSQVVVKDSKNVERFAPLFYVSAGQINFQIPTGTAEGVATLTFINGVGTSQTGLMMIGRVAPALFSADSTGVGLAAGSALLVRADGARTENNLARYDAATSKFIAQPIDMGSSGDQVYLTLYGTGIKNRNDLANVKVKIGGIDAPVEYAGAQGFFAGLDQLNVRMPQGLSGKGEVMVEVSLEGKAANSVKIVMK